MRSLPGLVVLMGLGAGFGIAGCSKAPPGEIKVPPVVVSIAQVQEQEIEDFGDFTGRTEASEVVEIKARATGYLQEVPFANKFDGKDNSREGEEVKKGDLLYKIDERTYRAELEKLEAGIARTQATVTRLNADLGRAKKMRVGDAISREEYDKIVTSRDEAIAQLGAAQAAVKRAQLDLSFTEVRAPIDGIISRTLVTQGNLVTQDQTLLTTIVRTKPIFAYFDIDERSVLEFRKKKQESSPTNQKDLKFPVYLGTQIEKGYPHEGYLDFAENRLDPSTGTLRVRGVFSNKKGILGPGLFVRLRLPKGEKHRGMVVKESALGTSQGLRFLYVVGEDNKVRENTVEVGMLREGVREILDGVKPGDWVVVKGMQRVREGVKVDPVKVEMFSAPSGGKENAATSGAEKAVEPKAPTK